ncbi:MAG: FISUMP domain-containing protein, partial [Bacteroidales bacterium]
KKYYYRAYATNSAGTSYGAESDFTTLVGYPKVTTSAVTSITETTATGGGNVTAAGGAVVTARGICWSLNQNPTTSDSLLNKGSGLGVFTGQMKNLSPNKTYYVRAYATNSKGTAYGTQVSFKTSTASPQVATDSAGTITSSTVILYGNVTIDGGSPIVGRGFCWSINNNPDINDNKSPAGTGTGIFSTTLEGLASYTKYYARAYAINSADTAYGEIISFTTLAELPILTTSAITSITGSSAISGGITTNNGGAPILSKGVCWNTTGTPTILNDTTSNGNGSGAFTSIIKGLTASATYYVRAYAQNIAGYNYGNQIEFKTLYETDSLTDVRDNQKYMTVKIGDTWWMAQNLNYRDTGTVYYNGDSATHAATYGRLYTWTSAMKGSPSSITNPSGVQGVCPSGWHLPANAEWNNLISELGGTTSAGSLLKETGNINWSAANTDATNESGFTARPGGIVNVSLASSEEGTAAYFWSSTETNETNAFSKKLVDTGGGVTENSLQKSNHLSVRCIKN